MGGPVELCMNAVRLQDLHNGTKFTVITFGLTKLYSKEYIQQGVYTACDLEPGHFFQIFAMTIEIHKTNKNTLVIYDGQEWMVPHIFV
jgi:hypothetical protein